MSGCSILAHLSYDVLISILSRSVINRYSGKSILFKEGEKAGSIWFIMSGKIAISKTVVVPKKDTNILVQTRSNSVATGKMRSQTPGHISSLDKSASGTRSRDVSSDVLRSKVRSGSLPPIRSRHSKEESASQGEHRLANLKINLKFSSRSGSKERSLSSISKRTEQITDISIKPSVPKFRTKVTNEEVQVSIDTYGKLN